MIKKLLLDTLYLLLFCAKDGANQYVRPLNNGLCQIITFTKDKTIVKLYDGINLLEEQEVSETLWSVL